MVGVMLFVSLLIGLFGLVAFLWGLKTGQFDDEQKMTHGVLFDGEEELENARKSASAQPEGATIPAPKKQEGT